MDPQEQNEQMSTPMTEEQTPTMQENVAEPKKERSAGGVIGIIIIIIILLVAVIYLFNTRQATPESIMAKPDKTTTELQTQSQSDKLSDINADLKASDFNNIDAELNQINQQLNAN